MGKIITGKYATVELTKVASRKTGEIEAQCALDASVADHALENGAVVFIDAKKDAVVTTNSADCVDAIYLHFSNPRRYGELESGMANFRYEGNDDYEEFGEKYLPRLYKLTTGDLFTTDCDLTKAVKATTLPKAGDKITLGNHAVIAVKETTMPNGNKGILYRVVK